MAKQEVGLKIDVDVSSVGNMKQQLRAATNELVAMNEKFGSSSKEATEAARRVAKLKDAIGDAKALADTFNPDKKFVALGGAVQGAVAGFSALQGAVGLFGDKSKEVEEVLLKVQSAMALQQGISGVAGAMDSFNRLSGVIKTRVVAAFTTLRGAMMATGIGLITSAVAFLVTNFDAVKKKLGELFPALEGTGDLMDRLKQIAMGVGNAIMQFLAAPVSALIKVFQGDFKGAIDAVKNGFSFVKNFREGEKKEIESQAAEAEEARQKELEKQKAANNKKLAEQQRINEELRKERQRAQDELNKFLDQENEKREKATMTEYEKELFDLRKNFAEKLAIAKKYNLDTKALNELFAEQEKQLTEKERVRKENQLKADIAAADAAAEAEVIAAAEKEKKDREQIDQELADADERERQRLEAKKQLQLDYNKALIDAEVQLQDAKFQAASAGLNALATLAQGNEKLSNVIFAVDKALAIAKIVVDTQREIATYMANPTWSLLPDGGALLKTKFSVAAKIRAAASIATIAATTIARFRGGGGGGAVSGGGGGGGVQGITTTAPVTPALAPQVVATQVNTAAVNQMGNRAARAYVLNSDIQNDNQRNAYIDRNASIG